MATGATLGEPKEPQRSGAGIIQNRILLVILGIIVVITILMAITFFVRRH
ncbi:Vesicle transport through interaction with t-SNAREs-like protein 1A [Sciurus carolinensis]|uniref:Vesicle transport through interaction with t-SNAREs-like protein 1A n=1 Tax=Sciurus carolinensis TaxID=30640 RepID=A0AA41SQJ2_SCICA|nr:Vesicle transport through interaction with t-SNAREs-like protein 1A [Sciurus carolinensis]